MTLSSWAFLSGRFDSIQASFFPARKIIWKINATKRRNPRIYTSPDASRLSCRSSQVVYVMDANQAQAARKAREKFSVSAVSASDRMRLFIYRMIAFAHIHTSKQQRYKSMEKKGGREAPAISLACSAQDARFSFLASPRGGAVCCLLDWFRNSRIMNGNSPRRHRNAFLNNIAAACKLSREFAAYHRANVRRTIAGTMARHQNSPVAKKVLLSVN